MCWAFTRLRIVLLPDFLMLSRCGSSRARSRPSDNRRHRRQVGWWRSATCRWIRLVRWPHQRPGHLGNRPGSAQSNQKSYRGHRGSSLGRATGSNGVAQCRKHPCLADFWLRHLTKPGFPRRVLTLCRSGDSAPVFSSLRVLGLIGTLTPCRGYEAVRSDPQRWEWLVSQTLWRTPGRGVVSALVIDGNR